MMAEQELLRLSEANPEGLSAMDPVKDFNIRDLDMVTTIARKQSLEERMASYACLQCPKFEEHVSFWRCFTFFESSLKFFASVTFSSVVSFLCFSVVYVTSV